MEKGAVTISIDLELAWGNWDNLTDDHARRVEQSERPVVGRLLELFDRYDIPVTWAFVAALLDVSEARGKPGPEHLWFAPDIIERILASRVRHELGSHGGRHRYFDRLSQAEADEDIQFARSVHAQLGVPLHSFVFPRNKVGRIDALARCGIRVFRGVEQAWHQRIRNCSVSLGRASNLVDKILPICPETVLPERCGELINLPGSMLFLSRGGLRSLVSPQATLGKLRNGMSRAAARGEVFHLWFHPSNFWHDTERQFQTFEAFLIELAGNISAGRLYAKPMHVYAQ